jgi:hypothetical protein
MSTGGVFKLIANDGKADRMLTATILLNQRIKDVICARRSAGKADITPTLIDLERTHILYVNAHFKPFAAMAYEYNKIRPTGTPSFGSSTQFSIPQFGDFFHDMVIRVRIGQVVAQPGILPVPGAGSPIPLNVAANGQFYNIVDHAGTILVPGAAAPPVNPQTPYRNFVRYCEFPGNRLFKKISFEVNGNPLDQYDEVVTLMFEKFCVAPNKRVGHDRLLGQEVPMDGYSGLYSCSVIDADAANTPAGITKADPNQSSSQVALFNTNIAAIGAAAIGSTVVNQVAVAPLNANASQYDVSRKLAQFVNGPQTPKPVQPPIELWSKLRFWFNEDVRLSIPSVAIPFGQRYINVDIAAQNVLLYEHPSIFLESILDPNPASNRRKTYTPIFLKNGLVDASIDKVEMYINNIFVNPEIHNIYIKRIGFSLIRVWRQHNQRCNQDSSDEKLLSQLKWPIEYMFIGLRPVWNTKDATFTAAGLLTGGNINQWRDWHRLTRMVDSTCDTPMLSETPTVLATPQFKSSIGRIIPDNYYLPVPTVNSLTLTSHGINIFEQFTDTFFNQYLPLSFGGASLSTPEDVGALFINMALFPRSYQPSGHLNISRARETYLKWTTSYVSARTPADLLVVASAINFLLITDGSAVLRYST